MKWHYVYGAVWTTPLGPEDGGQCVAVRASKSNLEPTEKDAALRLMAEAPDLLIAAQQALYLLTSHGITHPSIDATIRPAIALATQSGD